MAAGVRLSCIVMAYDGSQQYCCNEAQPPPPQPPPAPPLQCDISGAHTYFCRGNWTTKTSECLLTADIAADLGALNDASKVVDRPACVGTYTQSDLEYCQFLETTGSEGKVAAGISLSCVMLDYDSQQY